MKRLFRLVAISVAVLAAARSQPAAEKAAPPPPDVSGTWNLVVEYPGGTGNPVFVFKQDGGNLTGHYTGALGEAEVTGTIQGREIRFNFKVGDPAENIRYSGTVDGDSMKGTLILGSFGEGTFTGKKAAKK